MSNRIEVNDRIRSHQVRLIDAEGNQKGIMTLRAAIDYASSLSLDVVKISDATPPVCKVVDANKYEYDLQKQQKLQAKKQRAAQIEIKEVQLRPVTDTNDVKIKARKAREFIASGDKVKVVMRFRGREASFKSVGMEVMQQFISEMGEVKTEQDLKDSGRELMILLAPVAKVLKT